MVVSLPLWDAPADRTPPRPSSISCGLGRNTQRVLLGPSHASHAALSLSATHRTGASIWDRATVGFGLGVL